MIIASFFIGGMFAGCSKEVDVKPSPMNAQESALVQNLNDSSFTKSSIIEFFRGPFLSQVNTTIQTDSSTLIFDFVVRKFFMKGENTPLALPLGDAQFSDRGWKYEITFDQATGKILLSPNNEMQAGIFQGSFQTVLATFHQSNQTLEFIVRFKELNGNKSEVAETLFKR